MAYAISPSGSPCEPTGGARQTEIPTAAIVAGETGGGRVSLHSPLWPIGKISAQVITGKSVTFTSGVQYVLFGNGQEKAT